MPVESVLSSRNAQHDGHETPPGGNPAASSALSGLQFGHAAGRTETALVNSLITLPNRLVAGALRVVTLPIGRRWKAPKRCSAHNPWRKATFKRIPAAEKAVVQPVGGLKVEERGRRVISNPWPELQLTC